jgi:predicted amidohydrolase YtcJ
MDDGANRHGWLPDQKNRAEQAMTAYTVENDYAGLQGREVGRVAPGYLADIVVLDRDLTNIDPQAIQETKVVKTIVGGTERYSA